MTWLLALALAQTPASPDELLDEARRRGVIGDFEGMRAIAKEALAQDGVDDINARYLLAMSWEFDGQPDEALALYDDLLEEDPSDVFRHDLYFRRAETLGRALRFTDALDQLHQLPEEALTRPADQLKVAILDSLWRLESPSRRDERAALEDLMAALGSAAPMDAVPYQALGRARLAELLVNQADALPFRGPKRRKGKRLEERAALVQAATDELVAMVPMEAPIPTLETFLLVGEAYVAFGQAMLEESHVRGLSPDQRVLYESERAGRVEGVWVNASRYFDRGIQYSQRVGWVGPEVDALRQALTSVVERTEALASSPPTRASGS